MFPISSVLISIVTKFPLFVPYYQLIPHVSLVLCLQVLPVLFIPLLVLVVILV